MRGIDAFPVFAEVEGGGIAFRDATGRVVAPRRTPKRVVISRADCDLHPLTAPFDSAAASRRTPLEEARALFPEGVDGVEIEISAPLDGRRVVLLMRRETLAAYRHAAPRARLVLLADLLRVSLPGLGDDIVLHRGARHVELMRFQGGTLVDSLLVACRSGGSDGRGAAPATEATDGTGATGGEVMARAVALLASEGWLAGAQSCLHLLAPSAEMASLSRRLATLLAAPGSCARRGISHRFFGALAIESLRMRPETGGWFRHRGALGRVASSPVALLALLVISATALVGLFLRADTLEREAVRLRQAAEGAPPPAGPEASSESEIARLEREQARLDGLRPPDIYELLTDLRSAVGSSALLHELTLAQGVVDLRLAGPDPIETLRRLQAASCLREASLIEAVPSGAATGTEFHIRGRYP